MPAETSVARSSSMRALFLLVVLSAAPAVAQTRSNQCADCHVTHPTAPGRGHVMDWELSAHKRSGVGCERCHGGDPAAFQVIRAHFGITKPKSANSALNRRNVSATCGGCHRSPYSTFQQSRHASLLQVGDNRGPTCVTCHGEANAQVLSPGSIADECNQCHGPGKRAPRPDRAIEARRWLERVRDVRAQLGAVGQLVDAVRDGMRKQRLSNAYALAQGSLRQSIVDGHDFVFADSHERLDVVRQRTAELYQSIVNAPSQ